MSISRRDAVPLLSIVVAAGGGSRGLSACLEALAEQQGGVTEVLVVAADPQLPGAVRRTEWVRSVPSSGELVPELWRDGIDAARGELVALTTADHVPDRAWVQTILALHSSSDAVAIGGPVSGPDRGTLVLAIWFLRYGGLALIRGARDISDLAADNTSYKRAALVRHASAYRDGFWEPAVHRRMIASGERLRFDPSLSVKLGFAPRFGRFLSQRFRHGIHFGRWRAVEFRTATRIAAITLTPLIPLVFLTKIACRALRLRGLRLPFVISLPVLACLVLAWSLGEAWGYLSARWRGAAGLSSSSAHAGAFHGCNAGT